MKPCKNCGSYGANIGCDVCGVELQRIKKMDASDIIIAIRRIIVRGGTVHDILRFLDSATDPDADLDVPLGEACRMDDDTCEACQ